MTPLLQVSGLSCGYSGVAVLEDVDFSISAGEVCCILGPNGIGKTTLFKTILGSLPALSGSVEFEGEDLLSMGPSERALKIGYVPQAHTPPFPFTVLDVVEMGRTAHLSTFSAPSEKDRALSLRALNELGIAHLCDRIYTQISGGERQMVLIARALAQQAQLLVMDEPTANLDFGNQVKVLGFTRDLAQRGLSVLMTTHTPDHVFMCADTVIVIDRDHRCHVGPPDDVLSDELLSELYDVPVHIADVPTPTGTARAVVAQTRPKE
ncbi:MAG: ABC transporter ATP-binding protein [Coriobacteriales bacterium]|jgi:iron complex transport system ATP-binding protein